MRYVWETELMPVGNPTTWQVEHHLKQCLPKTEGSAFDYKFTAAWVRKVKDRKWGCFQRAEHPALVVVYEVKIGRAHV